MDPNYLEIIAAITGFISVYFVVRRNIWAFPIGIVMVALYIVIFYRAKFYGDMGLQVVYILMQIQGWYEWQRGHKASDQRIAIARLQKSQWLVSTAVLLLGTIALGFVLKNYTDAALPFVDAFTTSLSLIAQWWMNKKYLENWIMWIAVDVIYLYQYSYKELYYTTFLYAGFLVLAFLGYREWRREEIRDQ